MPDPTDPMTGLPWLLCEKGYERVTTRNERHEHGYAYCSCGRPVTVADDGRWIYTQEDGAMDVMTCTWCEDEQAVVQGTDEHNGPWSLCKSCLAHLVDSGEVWNEAGHIQRAAIRAIDAGVLDS